MTTWIANPTNALGAGVTLLLVGHVLYNVLQDGRENAAQKAATPQFAIGVSLIILAMSATYVGFITAITTAMAPLTDFLISTIGYPARLCTDGAGCTASYVPTDLLRVAVVIPVFIYASYRDIQSRIVRDHVWLPVFTFGLLFLLYDFWTGNIKFLAPWVFGNVLFATTLGYLMYKSHLFGGADMKALIGVGLLIPTYPALVIFPHMLPPVLPAPMNAANMFALTVLANTAIVAIIYPLYTLSVNMRDGFDLSRPGLMLTAHRASLEGARETHGKILPLWEYDGDGLLSRFIALIRAVTNGIETKFIDDYVNWHNQSNDVSVSDPTDLDRVYVERFLNSEANILDNGNQHWQTPDADLIQDATSKVITLDEVWVTPGIPFIVPMTLGLLISLILGDLMYWLVLFAN